MMNHYPTLRTTCCRRALLPTRGTRRRASPLVDCSGLWSVSWRQHAFVGRGGEAWDAEDARQAPRQHRRSARRGSNGMRSCYYWRAVTAAAGSRPPSARPSRRTTRRTGAGCQPRAAAVARRPVPGSTRKTRVLRRRWRAGTRAATRPRAGARSRGPWPALGSAASSACTACACVQRQSRVSRSSPSCPALLGWDRRTCRQLQLRAYSPPWLHCSSRSKGRKWSQLSVSWAVLVVFLDAACKSLK